ncbi:MAG: hypothetical protein KatS3mg105_2557 [Gemmatales bacterium]|nr:MAG: hypothetical protein KatS3mg105_2557 [Gemmatales bacterium]
MAVASGGALLDILQQHQILEPAQMEELRRRFTKRVPGPQKLVQELMRCRWLTPFQANLILQGKAKELILGSYVLLERLGAGGMGQVFKARHLHMRRLVALKIIRPEVASDADSLARFYREIQVTSQVDHPNVVRAYDAGPVGPHLGLAMEFIEGTDLAALVNKEGPLSVEQACDFVRQTALGLQHIHERGLIHRDMKPPNLVVTKECDASEYPYGQIKILDLGLARLRQPERDPSSRNLTQLAGDYVTMGTPDYLSPEQALDLHSADIRSDIYSLGCIFYFLLKGKPPFAGGSLAEKLMRHQKASPPPLEVPNAPPQLEAIIHRMLAKRPVERFPAPIDVVQAIDQLPLRKKKSVSSQWAKKSAVWLLRQPFRIAKWSLKQAAKLPPRVKITAAGVCLLLVAAFVGYRSFFPADTSVSDKKPGRQHQVGGDLSTSVPFSIPVERRQKWYPAELVGIIGDDRWRQAHSVISLAFCPDGRTFASSSTNGIFVWDSETGKLVSHRKAEPGEVLTIAFLDASRIVALKRYSNVITIWDWQTKTEKKHLLPVGNVTTIAASPDGKAVVVGGNQDALVFNVERGVRLQSYRSASSSSNFSVGFSRKGAKFASGRTGVKLWDVSAGREISLQSTVPDFSQKGRRQIGLLGRWQVLCRCRTKRQDRLQPHGSGIGRWSLGRRKRSRGRRLPAGWSRERSRGGFGFQFARDRPNRAERGRQRLSSFAHVTGRQEKNRARRRECTILRSCVFKRWKTPCRRGQQRQFAYLEYDHQ